MKLLIDNKIHDVFNKLDKLQLKYENIKPFTILVVDQSSKAKEDLEICQ